MPDANTLDRTSPTTALQHLVPGWYAIVMGLAGLSLAWHRAVPVLGDAAGAGALVIGGLAALVFATLVLAGATRQARHPGAWAEDLRHPVRHVFVAAIPISLLLLATVAVASGWQGPLVLAAWYGGALAQWGVTAWVLARAWRGNQAGGLHWAGLTPGLYIPVVGNVLVPLAGVPLGQLEWSAVQFGTGLFFWPVVTTLLLVRVAHQGLWPERLLPTNLIFVAPPAVVGLSALQFGAPTLLGWGLWGLALFSLLWVAPVLRRVADQPFALTHWAMSFPLAALTALTLRLSSGGPMQLLGLGLLALTSLLVTALLLGTLRGLRQGTLLVAEPTPAPPATAAR